VFYLGFPVAWLSLGATQRETGFVICLRNSVEILYLSWFVQLRRSGQAR
jgi:hypothetical protein